MHDLIADHATPAVARHSVDEAAIVDSARRDPALFAPLYDVYFPRIYRYCLRRVSSPDVAEDLTSTVFTRALVGVGTYRGGSVGAWLFQIAHRTVLNHVREGRRRRHVPLADAEDIAPDRSMAVLDDLVRQEERQRVQQLVATLSDEQQNLLTLKITGELTAREIGAVVGKSEGAVRIALHRIMEQLRREYRRVVGGDGDG